MSGGEEGQGRARAGLAPSQPCTDPLPPGLSHWHWGLLSSVPRPALCGVRVRVQQAECWLQRPETCLERLGCDFGRGCPEFGLWMKDGA